MDEWFVVDHLDIERLLSEWRWLCPSEMTLVARAAFGDLFLRDAGGAVFWLNTAIGKLTRVADSEREFCEMVNKSEKRTEWFAEQEVQACAKRGLIPTRYQCIAFSLPLIFAESGSSNTPYIVDIYECVAFLGDLNRQVSNLPDGSKVRLRVKVPEPSPPQ
jgi:hypothetical protein